MKNSKANIIAEYLLNKGYIEHYVYFVKDSFGTVQVLRSTDKYLPYEKETKYRLFISSSNKYYYLYPEGHLKLVHKGICKYVDKNLWNKLKP
jgi:hypothetical protein